MYKLKNGMNLPKEFKIKVNTKQSKSLQLYLFSVGYKYGDGSVNVLEKPYFYIHKSKRITCSNDFDYTFFNHHIYKLIKFEDYFEKVLDVLPSQVEYIEQKLKEKIYGYGQSETKFPEKWCIQVTEDNYKELNIWMHRNWKNYEGYRDTWCTVFDNYNKYFYSESVCGSCHSINDLISGFTLITTQQFREKFGIAKINETEIKAMESNIDFWHERANYHKQRCKYLRRERYEMSKEIEQLKSELELYNALKDLSNTMKKFLQ